MDGYWFQEQIKRSGRTQADLARHLRLNAAAVSRLFKGERQMKLLEAAQIAAYLGVAHDEVIRRAGLYDASGAYVGPAAAKPGQTPPVPPGERPLFGQRDLPVRGRAQGGPDGAIMLDNEPIDWAHRPAELQGTRDAFAMFVTGTSMGDVLPEGATVFIHPTLPVRPNDLVVVEKLDHVALIKRLVRRSGEDITLRQYDPAQDFDLPRSSVRALYRVIGAIFP